MTQMAGWLDDSVWLFVFFSSFDPLSSHFEHIFIHTMYLVPTYMYALFDGILIANVPYHIY